MSTLIYGNLCCKNSYNIIDSHIDYSLTNFCINNEFGIHFLDSSLDKKTDEINILFQLTDNFLSCNCENFFEPIIYSLDGRPQIDNLSKDIEKLYGLIETAFSFGFVQRVELKFSFGEVEDFEYEVCNILLQDIRSILLQKYLMYTHPIIKLIIKNK